MFMPHEKQRYQYQKYISISSSGTLEKSNQAFPKNKPQKAEIPILVLGRLV